MIYWINFVLYQVTGIAQITMTSLFLTPKYAKGKSLLLYILCIMPLAGIKFLMPIYSIWETLFAFANLAWAVAAGCMLFEEKVKGNLLASIYSTLAAVFAVMVCTIILPEMVMAENDTLMATLFFAASIIIFVLLFVVLKEFKHIFYKEYISVNDKKVIAYLLNEGVYYIFMSYMIPLFCSNTDFEYTIVISAAAFLIIATMFLATYMLLRKNEEQNQMERIRELEIAWESERLQYKMLLSKMGQMERIRHDFYGQLAAARHIMTLDRERGIKMIEELKGKILQEEENDIPD